MIRLALILLLAAGSLTAVEPFVVHEWGVLVRTATESPGLAPAAAETETLPGFVVRHDQVYRPKPEIRVWRKPILHFYGPEQEIQVQIHTPFGRPVAYWPRPGYVEQTAWKGGGGLTDATGLRWTGRLTLRPPADLPAVAAEHWWTEARQIPGLYFQSEAGADRFLFYEATATQPASVEARVRGDSLEFHNLEKTPATNLLLIITDGKRRFLHREPDIPPGGKVTRTRAELLRTEVADAVVLDACRAQWEGFGLTAAEARHVTEIWRPDVLGGTGFLLIARMARYDDLFPLTIKPVPDALVRVGLVFDRLAGEADRINWLPDLETSIPAWIGQLNHRDFAVRELATRNLGELGDLAVRDLEAVRHHADPEVRLRIRCLLHALEPGPNLESNALKQPGISDLLAP